MYDDDELTMMMMTLLNLNQRYGTGLSSILSVFNPTNCNIFLIAHIVANIKKN